MGAAAPCLREIMSLYTAIDIVDVVAAAEKLLLRTSADDDRRREDDDDDVP